MKHNSLISATLILILCATAHAGPARPITSGTFLVQSPCGPAWDGSAFQGQWFVDLNSGASNVNTWEYCDDDNSLTIAGVVQTIVFNANSNIVSFDVLATVSNSLPSNYQISGNATNSHGEVQLPQPAAGSDTMRLTRITAEFAIADASMPPPIGSAPPYWIDPVSGGQYHIVADNEDLWAWYCWDPNSGLQPAGNFQVPAWNLNPSDIPPGGTAQVLMQFSVTGSGMPSSDYRHSVIRASQQMGFDVLYNRYPSLKISHWLDTLLIDNGGFISTPLPPFWTGEEIEYIYASDASVFYNVEQPELPNKMHWPQLPDPNGWDVRACNWELQAGGDGKTKILADDFQCTANGPITNITFWGSFRYDEYDTNALFHGITSFHFSLHDDIPDPDTQDPTDYSMPAVPAPWQWNIDPYNPLPGWKITVEKEIIDSAQGWYDPNNPQLTEHPNHIEYFRYNLSIPPSNAFFQVEGNIYWLDISVQTEWPLWGWKTSGSDHFMDDAVWADAPVLNTNQWQELRDPFEPTISLDLAFVIDGGEEEPQAFDFGDAPDGTAGTGPGDYQTTLADTGAYHNIVSGAPYFDDGSQSDQPDGEPDGQPDPNAFGDDNNGTVPDDEDGIVFPAPLVAGQNGAVHMIVDDGGGGGGGGYVYAWVDFNADGDWVDANEQIYGGWMPQGLNAVAIPVPAGAAIGQTFARFRITSASTTLQPTGGPAPDGEVEDHAVYINSPPEELDYGDAPTNYPTLLVNNGARHASSSLYLGNLIDLEIDGQPTFAADGDDASNLADEDGIVFTTALISGSPSSVQVTVTGINGILQGWIDWNADGDWNDASEQIVSNLSVPAGTTTVNFSIPTWATNVLTYARFRISTQSGLGPAGPAPDGEVEDYTVDLEDLKWLQIPEQGKEGVDVNNTYNQLADDFQCTASGPITDIHIWGSFYNDSLPPEGPGELTFELSIWSDVPANVDAPYSHPGQQLWSKTFAPGQYAAAQVWTVPEGEWWHDPGTPTWIHPGDYNIYQFDFYPLPTDAFIQVEGTIYWLALQYFYEGEGVEFGWKTTPDAFNDDACYWDPTLPPIYWKDLVYGPAHERTGESLELAFALSGAEADVEDWGDAPDPTYPTLSASVGARHTIFTNFYLGNRIDAELDGQPSAMADGDDAAAFDDEDGVSFGSSLIRGSSTAVNVVLSSGIGNGVLDAWIDFDGNGTWSGSSERIFSSTVLSNGNNVLSFTTPTNAVLGTNYARFRLTQSGIATPGGAASEGEVEDYQVIVLQPTPSPDIVITNLIVTTSNNVATVEWNAQSGITYQMQSTTNLLISNSWINVGGYVVGPLNSQTNSAAPSNQFYRIMAPWTP